MARARTVHVASPFAPVVFAAFGAAACASSSRDVVPRSSEVHGSSDESDHYVYVVRRSHVSIGLAEARGIPDALARQAVDRLADQAEACTARLQEERMLVRGVGRLVAYISDRGDVQPPLVRAPAGGDIAQNMLLCFVSPLRQLVFPPAQRTSRGLAVEVSWSPL